MCFGRSTVAETGFSSSGEDGEITAQNKREPLSQCLKENYSREQKYQEYQFILVFQYVIKKFATSLRFRKSFVTVAQYCIAQIDFNIEKRSLDLESMRSILPSIFLQMPPKEKLSFYARQLINVNSHHIWLHQIKFSKAKGKKKALGSLKESLLRVMDNKQNRQQRPFPLMSHKQK